VTQFIAHFDTAHDYTLQFTVTHTHTSVHSHVFTAIAWWWLPMADVPLPVDFRNVPGLSYQLLTATTHNN
jgi:hypothetical protein